jgi:hypothetical protein
MSYPIPATCLIHTMLYYESEPRVKLPMAPRTVPSWVYAMRLQYKDDEEFVISTLLAIANTLRMFGSSSSLSSMLSLTPALTLHRYKRCSDKKEN